MGLVGLVLALACDAPVEEQSFRDDQVSGESEEGPSDPPPPLQSCTDAPTEECCVASCGTEPAPFPGDETQFDCPVADMPYNCGCEGTDLFDCDDFAYACEVWGLNNGYNVCKYEFSWILPDGTWKGHVINIVEFEYEGPFARFCLIEPQSNGSRGCWIQEEGDPVVPQRVQEAACARWGGTCEWSNVNCSGKHGTDFAGEACFNTQPEVCERFRRETGLCPYTFEPDHDCRAFDLNSPTADPCYWSCPEGQTCGLSCDACIPEPTSDGADDP